MKHETCVGNQHPDFRVAAYCLLTDTFNRLVLEVISVPKPKGFRTLDRQMDATTMGEIVDFFQNSSEPDIEAISVLLVDDQQVFRNVARSVLERDGACEVIGEAVDGAHAIELMGKLTPDIVVMDVQMEDMSGVEATRRILSQHPDANVVLTSMGSDSEYPTLAREIGARGFVPKRNLNVSMLRSLVGGGPSGGSDAIAA